MNPPGGRIADSAARRQGDLSAIARDVRKTILEMIHRTKSPHIGPSLSIVEILVSMYFKHMNVDPTDPGRDRFILSKGHACAALYAVLEKRGLLGAEDISRFAVDGGALEQHPRHDPLSGIEATTGSLGHGLSIGAGMALAARADGSGSRVFVLMSDGELNEGSVWEAAMFSAHHALGNLVALVDSNKMQALGRVREVINSEPLVAKWESFGWRALRVDGHSLEAIDLAISSLSPDRPNVVILDTVKGKGVSFMENEILWHYRAPDESEYGRALGELDAE